jgi:glutaredoxin 3
MGKIEIYTKSYCPYCHRAKELLKIKGVNFTEYDVSQDPEREAEMLQRSGRSTVPEIFINNQLIGGCDELFSLDEKGGLDPLIA